MVDFDEIVSLIIDYIKSHKHKNDVRSFHSKSISQRNLNMKIEGGLYSSDVKKSQVKDLKKYNLIIQTIGTVKTVNSEESSIIIEVI